MGELTSFLSVILLWIGVSLGSWWLHRLWVHHKQRQRLELADEAWARLREAPGVFDDIRLALPPQEDDSGFRTIHRERMEEGLQAKTNALLQRIQLHQEYFGTINALRAELSQILKRDDCPPLSELLNLRRDIWAAADVLLIDDPETLGDAFAESGSYEQFCREAAELLFKAGPAGKEDPIDLRLMLAAEDMERFVKEVEDQIEEERERERLPTFSEIISYPIATARAIPRQLREARDYIRETYSYVEEVAGTVRRSGTIRKALGELRRARAELPERFSRSIERATDIARETTRDLSRHYEFLIEAHKFRTRYEAMLRRAPDLSEKGRQFIARLELEKRSEQFRLRSAGARRRVKLYLVKLLGKLILWLERLRDRLIEPDLGDLGARRLAPPMRRLFLPSPGGDSASARGQETGAPDGNGHDRRWRDQFGWAGSRAHAQGPRGTKPRPATSAQQQTDELIRSGKTVKTPERQDESHADPTKKSLDRLRTLFGQKPRPKPRRVDLDDLMDEADEAPVAEPPSAAAHNHRPAPETPQILPPLLGSQTGGYDSEPPRDTGRSSLLSRLASLSWHAASHQDGEDETADVSTAGTTERPPGKTAHQEKNRRWWQRLTRI